MTARNQKDKSFLGQILGSEIAAKTLLFLAINEQGFASQIAETLGLNVSVVHAQLLKFESAGVLARRNVGRSAVFAFAQRGLLNREFLNFLSKVTAQMPLQEKAHFAVRARPRVTAKKLETILAAKTRTSDKTK